MTVIVETNSVQYVAAGIAVETFPTVFKFFDPSDVIVLQAGVVQTRGVNYSLSGGGGAVGTVTWIGSTTAAALIDIIRRRPATQGHNYIENDAFPAETHEDTVDKLAMAVAARLGLSTTDPRDWDAGAGAGGGTRKILNLATPTLATDAATKAYVDAAGGLPVSLPVPADPADDDKFLRADAGVVTWQFPPFAISDLPGGGDTGDVLTATGAGTFNWQTPVIPTVELIHHNYIINPHFEVFTKGPLRADTSVFTNDDAEYAWDRWIFLAEADDVCDLVSMRSGSASQPVPPGSPASARMEVETATDKFGLCQYLYEVASRGLLVNGDSSQVTLQFKARTTTGAAIANVKVAIYGWSGTADACPLDPVSAWNIDGVDPDMVASFTQQGSTSSFALIVDTFTQHSVTVTCQTGASIQNLMVFIWFDTSAGHAVDDVVYISDVMLEAGDTVTVFNSRSRTIERVLCAPYMWSTTSVEIALTEPIDDAAGTQGRLIIRADASGNYRESFRFPTSLPRAGTVGANGDGGLRILAFRAGGAAGTISNLNDDTDHVAPAVVVNREGFEILQGSTVAGNANDLMTFGVFAQYDIGH